MHREVDERIAKPPIELAMVPFARALGQRLQRGAQRGAPDFVEDALHEDHAIVGRGEGEAPRLHALFLFVHETLGVGRMPSMHAGVVEAPDTLLGRFPEQLALIKAAAKRCRGSRQQHEMGATDPALDHSVLALPYTLPLLACAYTIA